MRPESARRIAVLQDRYARSCDGRNRMISFIGGRNRRFPVFRVQKALDHGIIRNPNRKTIVKRSLSNLFD
jgi:hypothetical protein